MNKKIIVIGAFGQLGKSIQQYLANIQSDMDWKFYSRSELDILNYSQTNQKILEEKPAIIINCSAYTAVDKAESDIELANAINHLAVENIAICAQQIQATLIHVSTDFVFDGTKNTPLNEEDFCNPLGVYGKTKFDGEQAIIKQLDKYYIIRTSWLYSNISSNFYTNISKYAAERPALNIVFDQVGTPTYTFDLVKAIFKIIDSDKAAYGIYHFSNEGVCSWYDFAKELVDMQKINCTISPILSEQYPTPAKRPPYSVLNKQKIKTVFDLSIPHWRESLKIAIDTK